MRAGHHPFLHNPKSTPFHLTIDHYFPEFTLRAVAPAFVSEPFPSECGVPGDLSFRSQRLEDLGSQTIILPFAGSRSASLLLLRFGASGSDSAINLLFKTRSGNESLIHWQWHRKSDFNHP